MALRGAEEIERVLASDEAPSEVEKLVTRVRMEEILSSLTEKKKSAPTPQDNRPAPNLILVKTQRQKPDVAELLGALERRRPQ